MAAGNQGGTAGVDALVPVGRGRCCFTTGGTVRWRACRHHGECATSYRAKWNSGRLLRPRFTTWPARWGFREIRTPVVEHTEVFQRTAGEDTDLVAKEMYTFVDRGGRSLSLRPEGTAPVMRAYLEHGLQQGPQPGKFYYIAPMFRYDRPQKGRYRQHMQFGAEIIGSPHPAADAEVLTLPVRLLQALGLAEVEVRLNSVGDAVCRPRYLAALREYFTAHLDEVCEDCRHRVDRNPLRVLDCKRTECQQVVRGAPSVFAFLCEACRHSL